MNTSIHGNNDPLDETLLARMRKDIDQALQAVGERYGTVLKAATSHLGARGNRCEVIIRGVQEGTEVRGKKVKPRTLLPIKPGETREENRWRSFAKEYSIPQKLLHNTVTINGKKAKVIGMKGKGNYVVLRPVNGSDDFMMKPEDFLNEVK